MFPATASAEQVREHNPDCIFLSNGPGDPAAVPYVHETVTRLLPDYPMFGICLGHQMITHALGGTTFKLKFGHRGGNQPVKNVETGRVSITAQNHGFATDPASVEQPRERSSPNQPERQDGRGPAPQGAAGLQRAVPPRGAPGPNDADPLFVDFYHMVEARKAGKV